MSSDKVEVIIPGEVLDNWSQMDMNEKVKLLTSPSPEMIKALTAFVTEFNKPNERVALLRKDRNDVLIELLKKEDRPFEETIKLIELLDKGIEDEAIATEKGNNQNIRGLAAIGGIVTIVAGSAVAAKVDKKAGVALITAGTAALIAAGGSDTKVGKTLLKYLSKTLDESVAEA